MANPNLNIEQKKLLNSIIATINSSALLEKLSKPQVIEVLKELTQRIGFNREPMEKIKTDKKYNIYSYVRLPVKFKTFFRCFAEEFRIKIWLNDKTIFNNKSALDLVSVDSKSIRNQNIVLVYKTFYEKYKHYKFDNVKYIPTLDEILEEFQKIDESME